MSVRRLAKEQPASFTFSKATKAKADWWIAKYPENRRQSAVIPILWLVQKQEGWVSEPAIRAVANLLDMPVIRVLEVATFYTMFQLEPVGTSALRTWMSDVRASSRQGSARLVRLLQGHDEDR